MTVDDRSLDPPVEVRDRTFGVNYYGVDELNIDLGTGDEVFNVQGTTAVTNVYGRMATTGSMYRRSLTKTSFRHRRPTCSKATSTMCSAN